MDEAYEADEEGTNGTAVELEGLGVGNFEIGIYPLFCHAWKV